MDKDNYLCEVIKGNIAMSLSRVRFYKLVNVLTVTFNLAIKCHLRSGIFNQGETTD